MSLYVANENQEEKLGDLPPLDIAEDEGEGPAGEQMPELTEPSGEEEEPAEEDGIDVDVGIDLGEESEPEDERPEMVLDIAELLAVADERESEEDPDSLGPGSTLEDDIDPEGEGRELLGSSEEGVDEPLEDLVKDELPELDADEPGGFDDAFSSDVVTRDEELPPQAAVEWSVTPFPDLGTGLSAVELGPRCVVIGGHGVAWLTNGAVLSAPIGGARVRSVAPMSDGSLFCTTLDGALLRIAHGSAETQGLPEALIALGVRPGRAPQLACATFPEGGPRAVVAHAGGTRLVTSKDAGASWQTLEVGGRIVAATTGQAPTRLVARGHEGFGLLIFEREGESLSRIPLDDRVAEEILGHDSTLIAALPGYVALASRDGEFALSRDGGKSFSRIDGCQRPTALTAGMRAGRPRVWLTLFQEALERVVVVEVDAETGRAECIAELRNQESTEENLDTSVTSLCFDPEADELLAASDAGLSRIRPGARRELADAVTP